MTQALRQARWLYAWLRLRPHP